MKRMLLYTAISLCFTSLFSQVGIGTTNPQQTLHVAGQDSSIRIDGLSAVNHPLNDGQAPISVKVDENGDLILVKSPRFLSSTSQLGASITHIESPDGRSVRNQVYANSFTLDTPGVVVINYTMRVGGIQRPDGQPIRDGAPRIISAQLFVNGDQVNRDAQFFTDDSNNGTRTASGPVVLSGTVFLELPAGTHNYSLMGRLYGNKFGVEANFGGPSSINQLQVLKL